MYEIGPDCLTRPLLAWTALRPYHPAMRIDLPTSHRNRILAVSSCGNIRLILRFHLGVPDRETGIRPLVGTVREQRRHDRPARDPHYTSSAWYSVPRRDFSSTITRQPLPEPGYQPDASDLDAAARLAWPKALQTAQDRFAILRSTFRTHRPDDLSSRGTGAPRPYLKSDEAVHLFGNLGDSTK